MYKGIRLPFQWNKLCKKYTITVVKCCNHLSPFILFVFLGEIHFWSYFGKRKKQDIYVKHNLFAALGLEGDMGHLASSPTDQPPSSLFRSVLSSSGENSGLWENSKMSVFSKRPLPSFPCSSMHFLPSPTINPFFLLFPQCRAVCSGTGEIIGHLRSNKRGETRDEGVKLKDWIEKKTCLLVWWGK